MKSKGCSPVVDVPATCVTMIPAKMFALSRPEGFLIEFERKPTEGERRNIVDAITRFPKNHGRNKLGITFRFALITHEDPSVLILQYAGLLNDHNRLMEESKQHRVSSTAPLLRPIKMDQEPKMLVVIDAVRALLSHCCIAVTQSPVCSRDDRRYHKVQPLIPAELLPGGAPRTTAPRLKVKPLGRGGKEVRRRSHP